MVNIEVVCPHYDDNKRDHCNERFTIALEEHRLYSVSNPPFATCPVCRRKIILNNKRYYRILDPPKKYEPTESPTFVSYLRATKKGKYSAKQRKRQLRRSQRDK